MAVSFVGTAASATGTATTTLTVNRASTTNLDFLLIVFGVEGVAAGSGPWVFDNPAGGTNLGTASGWLRACYQAPSSTGCGLEAWVAINGGVNAVSVTFSSAVTVVAQMLAWRGVYYTSGTITDGALRGAATAQVTGNNPAAPSIFAFAQDLLIALASEQMASPGFGTPTPAGWASRTDIARSGFGTVEVTVADLLSDTTTGATGTIPWSATAAAVGDTGATATLDVRPLASPAGSGAPLIEISFPLT